MALIAVFAGVVLLFKVQNLDTVTVSLFSFSATLPLSPWMMGPSSWVRLTWVQDPSQTATAFP